MNSLIAYVAISVIPMPVSDVDVLLDKAPQDTIEKELMAKIPRSEVYIHAEPQDISHIQTEAEGTTKI